jgi:hypothetical protein
MQVRVRLDRDRPAQRLLQVTQHGVLFLFQRARNIRVHP